MENGRLDPALYVQEEGPSVSWGNNVRTDYTVTGNIIMITFIDVFYLFEHDTLTSFIKPFINVILGKSIHLDI